MFKYSLGFSIAAHILLGGFLWKKLEIKKQLETASTTKSKSLNVRSLSDQDLAKEIEARKKLQNTGQVVHADEQLKVEAAPQSKTEKIFLSKFNQRVDKNTRAPRIGEFKNVLEEGLEDPHSPKEAKGSEVVAEKKQKAQKLSQKAFDPNNLFALASDYKESAEAKVAEKADNNRAPASVLKAAGGKKGQGFSATDDYLEGVGVGANTLLNTQQFKYYSFYERVRMLLVERWKSRIRREIEKARLPASDGTSKLSLGSKITKLQVRIGPTGEIVGIEKVGISGIESFDKAAEVSFHEAAPFPHPPKEMLKNDELTIQWDFVVVVEDSSLVKFNVQKSL